MADLLPNPQPPFPPTSSTSPSTNPNPNPKIHLRSPSIYKPSSSTKEEGEEEEWRPPTLSFLERTWHVTHSTLPMWRKAKRVRITYKVLDDGKDGEGKEGVKGKLDDCVESVPIERTLLPQPKSIHGIDTPDPHIPAAWNWRGKGWLKIASSHWEVLGWGEYSSSTSTSTSTSPAQPFYGNPGTDSSVARQEEKEKEGEGKEKWVITWFAPSMFTPAGVDIYSDRPEGGSEGLVKMLLERLEGMEGEVGKVCREEMRSVRLD